MWQSLSKLFARLHMLKLPETIVDGNVGQEYVDKIIELLPTKVIQRQTHESIECYKVMWAFKDHVVSSINSSRTSFTTMEWKSLVDIQYPALVEEFSIEQRRAEQLRAKESRQVLFHGRTKKNHPIEGSKRVFKVALGPSKGCAEVNPYQKTDDIVTLTRFAAHSSCCYRFERTNNTQFEVKQINKHSKITQDDSPFIIFKPQYSIDSPFREQEILETTPLAMKKKLENAPDKKKRKGMPEKMDINKPYENSSENYDPRNCIDISMNGKPLRLRHRDPLTETGEQNTNYGYINYLLRKEENFTTPVKNKTNDPQSDTKYNNTSTSTTPIKNNKKNEMLIDTDKQHACSSPSSLCDSHLKPENLSRTQKATPKHMLSTTGRFEMELLKASEESRFDWKEPKKEEGKLSKLGTVAVFWMNMIQMSPVRTSKTS
jgi:hypothetical protein